MANLSHKIFIDATVLFAFIDRTHPNHQKAIKAFESFARSGFQLYTSSLAMIDTYSVVSREVGYAVALEFLETMLQSEIEILFPQKGDFTSAWRILKSNRGLQINLKEALNATLMQKRDIPQILIFTYWHNLFGTKAINI
jgi:predicted nucleic acid-binding protein